jgi:HEAT repeat protein
MSLGDYYRELDPEIARKRSVGSLKDESSLIRMQACQALGLRGDRSAVPALIRALDDPSGRVRWMAGHALADIGDPRALPALESAYYRSSKYTRARAANRFKEAAVNAAELDREGTVSFLLERFDSSGALLRHTAREALGEIGDPAAVDPLINALATDGLVARTWTFEALINIGDARAIPALRRAAKRRFFIRPRKRRREVDQLEGETNDSGRDAAR